MTKSMTSGNPAKLLLLFAIPVIFGNMFQQLYSIVDTIIVGRALGVHALAAVGCTGSITFLVLGFVNGFTQGLAIITSQRFGAGGMAAGLFFFAGAHEAGICQPVLRLHAEEAF